MQSKARCEIQRPPKYKAATSEGDRTHTTAQCKNVFELTSLGCASLPYSTRHDNARRLYTTEPLSLSQGACRAEPASTDGGSNGNRAPPAEQLASHTGYSYPTGKRQPTPTGEAEQPRTVSGTAMQDFSIFLCCLGNRTALPNGGSRATAHRRRYCPTGWKLAQL